MLDGEGNGKSSVNLCNGRGRQLDWLYSNNGLGPCYLGYLVQNEAGA